VTHSPIFLTIDQVLAIHSRMIAEFGGDAGLRDSGLLESAVTMPQAAFGNLYLHKGIPAMAAAYLFHICKNHPFVDGNKRAAFAAAEVFIALNGYRLVATNDQCETWTMAVAQSTMEKQALTKLFRQHTKRVK